MTTFAGSSSGGGFVDGTGSDARFLSPDGLAIDATGNLYVADRENHSIRKITPAGVVSTVAGTGKSGFKEGVGSVAQFYAPTGIAVDAAENLYVSDSFNNRIRKIIEE